MKIKIKTDQGKIKLHYVELGVGQPIVFIHGWPLSHKMWEPQLQFFADHGFRSIAYDRRGFGDSEAPKEGYDYTLLAEDLHQILVTLDLKNVILCGFSMGGGEVVRYLTRYGAERIDKVILMGSIIPLVKRKPDNPAGVAEEDLAGIIDSLKNNRIPFLKEFGKGFLNYDSHKGTVPEALLDYNFSIAAHASPIATIQCAEAWAHTDFRSELMNVTVPTLIIHGDADAIVPIATSGDQAATGIKNNRYVVIKGGSHGLNITHRDEVNTAMLDFLRQ
ncbi:alpha/beta fold hydrolase [Dyadobacter tibetensis]|uniref:alpha/beta fold hydrolase n=1 Tax=Dyadobacter tibetensis TaxID=1211851 RepID=UPI0004724A35|nr:alpha/beta hydrolase [Dyadobacter tibetensis]